MTQTKGVKHRQITAHFQNLINKGELKPGTRLPTTRKLAKEWGTNNSTIHLALTPLVNEGLIERNRRHGTFVRDSSTQIASVAIYCGGDLWSAEQVFYQHVYRNLNQLYRDRKSRSVLFIDPRSERDKHVSLPELQKAVDQREVQGVIALMLGLQGAWLPKLQVPVSMFGTFGLHTDYIALFDLALARLAADGCRTVGLIYPRLQLTWHTVFKNLVHRHGMETHPDWIRGMETHDLYGLSIEFCGYHMFKDLWSVPNHPEGLFVYPDVACRGAMVAALALGLSIPRDLRLIFHRNKEIDYPCPWKIPFVVSDIKEVVQLLVAHLDAQFRHEPEPSPVLYLKLVD